MKFCEKLQQLRKQYGYTQEELAEKLHVSRTAISKWESDRGYPNIESLKNIAKIFSISIDELLSTEQLLQFAQADNKKKASKLCDLIYGLLDICVSLLLFLPLFAQRSNHVVKEVSLLALNFSSDFILTCYYIIVLFCVLFGIAILTLQNFDNLIWIKIKVKISLLLTEMLYFVHNNCIIYLKFLLYFHN